MTKSSKFRLFLSLSPLLGMLIFVFGLMIALAPSANAQISLRLEGHYPFYGDTSDLFTTVTYKPSYKTPKVSGKMGFAATGSYLVNDYLGIGLRFGEYTSKYTRGDTYDAGAVSHHQQISSFVIMPEINGHYWIDENKNYGIYGVIDLGYVKNKFDYANWNFDELPTVLANNATYEDYKSSSSGFGSGLELGFEYNGYERDAGPTIGYFIGARVDWLGSIQNGITGDLRAVPLSEPLTLYSIVTGLTINY